MVEEFFKAGILLQKIDKLRPTALAKQGYSYRLGHPSNMKEYIPMIYKQEIQRIKAEIRREPSDGRGEEFTRDLSIIFDGGTRPSGRGDRDRGPFCKQCI